MSTLTGNQVKDTYQGLLKLANSATGVTGTLQYVQDGLGNNIPLQVSDDSINLTGSIYFNNVLFTGTTNGSSGTSGTSGINGSSGTSGTSGTGGSSGTSGTSGSNGSSGTSGTSGSSGTSGTSGSSGSSGTSGVNGSSGTSGTSGSSGSSGTSGSDGSSGTSGTSGTSGSSGSSGTSGSSGSSGTSGSSGSSGTSGSNGSSGTSGTSGSSGSSGTSGSNGSSGTSGTSGTAGTSGDSIFAQTGSYWAATKNIQVSGSVDVWGNNLSLLDSSQVTNVTSSIAGSANLLLGFPRNIINYPNANAYTGSIVISGSNNITPGVSLTAFEISNTSDTSAIWWLSGSYNISRGVSISPSSISRPRTNYNIGFSPIAIQTTSSSLAQPIIDSNLSLGLNLGQSFQHNSGSLTLQNNVMVANITSVQQVTPAKNVPVISSNFIGGAITLQHVSSSITFQSNLHAAAGTIINNQVSTSFAASSNGITMARNLFLGSTNTVAVSGSQSTAQVRTLSDNIIGGNLNTINSQHVGSNNSHLNNTIIFGQSLIVSASNAATLGGGSAFLGRYNDTSLDLHKTQEIVFAVGTGTGGSNRRTGFWITSGSFVNVSGSLAVTGSASITGSLTVNGQPVSTVDTGSFITTGSVTQTQRITGSLELLGSGSINGVRIISGSQNSVAIGPNALNACNDAESDNVAVGSDALRGLRFGKRNVAVGKSAGNELLSGSDNTFIGQGIGSNFKTGSNNTIMGTYAGNAMVSGSDNLFLGSNAANLFVSGNYNTIIGKTTNGNYTSGSNSVIIGAENYSFNIADLGDELFAIGVRNNTPVFLKKSTGPLRISSDTTISGSLIASGSARITGSLSVSGAVDVNNSVRFKGSPNVAGTLGSEGLMQMQNSATFNVGNFGAGGYFNSGSNIYMSADTGSLNSSFQMIAAWAGTESKINVNNSNGSKEVVVDTTNFKVTGSLLLTGSMTIANAGDLTMYGHKMFNVGAFQTNVTQSGSANVSQSVNFEVTDISKGVSITSGSRLTYDNAGTYSTTFSAQLLANAGADTVYMWLKKNGTNVPESATKMVLKNNEESVMTVNFLNELNANDYLELAWQSENGDAELWSTGSVGNIPAIPSVIITSTQVR